VSLCCGTQAPSACAAAHPAVHVSCAHARVRTHASKCALRHSLPEISSQLGRRGGSAARPRRHHFPMNGNAADRSARSAGCGEDGVERGEPFVPTITVEGQRLLGQTGVTKPNHGRVADLLEGHLDGA